MTTLFLNTLNYNNFIYIFSNNLNLIFKQMLKNYLTG